MPSNRAVLQADYVPPRMSGWPRRTGGPGAAWPACWSRCPWPSPAFVTSVFVTTVITAGCTARARSRRVVYALQARQFESGRPGVQSAADAPLAQSAERLHGKEKVYGSIP
jgi:hypothetical protein